MVMNYLEDHGMINNVLKLNNLSQVINSLLLIS